MHSVVGGPYSDDKDQAIFFQATKKHNYDKQVSYLQ